MSAGNPEQFPWGANEPTVRARVLVALAVAVIASCALYPGLLNNPAAQTDFHMLWFASKSFVSGRDPYQLVGPKLEYFWPYPMLWPGTALVAVAPFTILPVWPATLAFVFLSCFLLTFGMTRGSWHRLPMLVSAAFLDSVMAAQWSIPLTAALFVPEMAFFASVKPQTGIPVLSGATTTRGWLYGIAGTLLLLTISVVVLPGWPMEWLSLIRNTNHMKAPFFTLPGFLILLLLLRWRRSESWLVLAGAAMPQTLMWYSGLMPLAIANTYREACVLSIASTLGFLASAGVATAHFHRAGSIIWTLFTCSVYLPAVALILRRPREGQLPVFLKVFDNPRGAVA